MKHTLHTFALILLTLMLTSYSLMAQKKQLTHDVYDAWESIPYSSISSDGEHILFIINPEQGDGTLFLHERKSGEEQTFRRGADPDFSFDSQYAVFKVLPQYDSVRQAKLDELEDEEMPKDSLFAISLLSGEVYRHARVQSYKMPEKAGGWLAFLLEDPLTEKDTTSSQDEEAKGHELVVLNMSSMEEQRFEGVEEYLFSENGRQLLFNKHAQDSAESAGVYAFDTDSETVSLLDSGKITYQGLTLSEDGSRGAFLASEDSTDAEERYFGLYLWDGDLRQVADTTSVGIFENWMVSEHETPFFSEDASRLFFGTAPRPVKYAYEEDTLLDEERVVVDIWSWEDDYVQPMQKERAEEENKRAYMTMYDIPRQRIVPLTSAEMPDLRFDREKRLPYAIGLSDLPYRQEITWEYPFRRDAYLVDLNSGEKTKIATATTGYPSVSPGAEYAYWYEAADSSWLAYEVASGEIKNLTISIDANFYDETNDRPMLPGSYGAAGWTENDEHFLVYDYYDIWKIDPKSLEASNLTDGYGRANDIALRYQKTDPEEYFIPVNDEILLEAFHRTNKQSGFYREHTGRNRQPEKLVMGDYAYYYDEKARNSNEVLFRRSSFVDFPDVWLSTLDFEDMEKISEANPQQSEYLWGSVDLVSWLSPDGTPLQGMLYKPENFDPDQKYPMIVYFYERNSDNLHRHWAPEAHRSIINFTFYTSRGYLVFVPDIAYTEGYPGESAFKAVVSGTNYVSGLGYVDTERIAMQGHSWGGYQSAYIITRTNMFRAAEAGAPVANMTSAYGGVRWGSGMSRMFQYERTQSRIGGTLWEYPMRYLENSPLFAADRIETPLLIMHNDEDTAVPWEQGIELFMALRRLEKPVWMLNYNGEPHWPLKYPNRKDFARRMQQFFDHYLKDEPMPEWMEEGIPATLKGRTLRYESSKE